MAHNATEKYGGDETGSSTIVTTKSKGLYQHIRAPSTSLPASMGSVIVFEVTEKPSPNSLLHDLRLKYRFQNTAVAPATDSFRIPVSGIWSLIQSIRVHINGMLAFEILNAQLKDRYHFQLHNYEDVNCFLNERMSTVNQTAFTGMTGTRTLGPNTTSTIYSSSFREILGDLFRNRHISFMHKIEFEIQLFSPQSDYLNTKQIGYIAGSNMNNLRISSCQLVCEYVQYDERVPLLMNAMKSELPLPWYDYQDYTLAAQAAGTISINLFTGFPQRPVISKIRFWITNSLLNGTFTVLNNHTVYRNSFITAVEIQKNGNRVCLWEGAELYKVMAEYQRRRGLQVRDSVYSNTDLSDATPYNFVSFERDFMNLPTEGTTNKIHKLTGIDNDQSNQWVVNISYDLTGQDVALNTLRVAMESTRILCLNSDPKKPINVYA